MASSFEGLAAELSPPSVRVLEATPAAALLPFAKSERQWAQDSLADLITSSAFSTVGELLRRGDIVLSGREHRALREVLFGVVRRLAVHLVPPSAAAKPSAAAARPGASRPKPYEAPAPSAPVTLPDVVGPADGARLDAWAAAHGATAVLKALALALAPEHLHLALHRALWPREAVATVREALLATPRRLDDEFTQAQAALLDMLREYPARVARARVPRRRAPAAAPTGHARPRVTHARRAAGRAPDERGASGAGQHRDRLSGQRA